MAKEKDTQKMRKADANIRLIRFMALAISYLLMSFFSILVIVYANRRGAPTFMLVLYYVAMALNLSQFVLTIVKFILQKLGYFIKELDIVEYSLGIAWLGVVAFQCVMGSVIFGLFRLDLLLITILQLMAITLILVFSKGVEYNTNKRFARSRNASTGTGEERKESFEERKESFRKREAFKAFSYLTVLVLILALQITTLFVPKLPPRIDDIFSENRTIEYVYYKNVKGYADGYYVKDLYFGVNSQVEIPLTYNNQPVVGVLSGAITDVGRINSIQMGEYNTRGVLHSNLKVIESGGISLDRISKIDIPDSVEVLEEGAVSGERIRRVNYFSSHIVSLNAFSIESLEKFNLRFEETAVSVDIPKDHPSYSSVKVTVPKELYNEYRERFFDNRKLFEIEEEEYIIIDFETGTEIFLESKILHKNAAKLDIESLINEGEISSFLMADTVKYNENNYYDGKFSSKSDHVFRGWYRDAAFVVENVFDNNPSYFDKNTTIYAKWSPIKTVELDWNQYYPYNEKKTLITFVESTDLKESKDFPKFEGKDGSISRIGYEDLVWEYAGQSVERTFDLFDIDTSLIQVKANWILKKPEIQQWTKVLNNGVASDYYGSLIFTFDEMQKIIYNSTVSHELSNVALTYSWYKENLDLEYDFVEDLKTTSNDPFTFQLFNCSESGTYRINVTAQSPTGEKASAYQNYTIKINKKDITIEGADSISHKVSIYNALRHEFPYPDEETLAKDIKVTSEYKLNASGGYGTLPPINVNDSFYEVRFVFEKTGEYAENYNFAYKYSRIYINPKDLTIDWNVEGWENATRAYDANYQRLAPIPVGVLGSDIVSFVVTGDYKKDVGRYSSTVTGVSNTNYRISQDEIDANNTSKAWEIIPKELVVSWGPLEKEYTGKTLDFVAQIYGIEEPDKEGINLESFDLLFGCDRVEYNSFDSRLTYKAKDTDEYQVDLVQIYDNNYTFSPSSELVKIIKITPANLSVNWFNFPDDVYDGYAKKAVLTIGNFKEQDLSELYDEIMADLVIGTSFERMSYGTEGKKLVVEFEALNQGDYSVWITEKRIVHYKITLANNQLNRTYSILPRVLNVGSSWDKSSLEEYNGEEQIVTFKIANLNEEDVNNMLAEDFIVDNLPVGVRHSIDKFPLDGRVDVNFYAKNAGTYEVAIDGFNRDKFLGNFILNGTDSKQFKIEKRELEVRWDNSSFEYNSLQQKVIVAEILNRQSDEDFIEFYYSNNEKSEVGNYIATLTTSNTNYATNTSTCNHSWKITKKDIIASIRGSGETYDGKYKYFDIVYENFEESDWQALNETDFAYETNNNAFLSFDMGKREGNTYVITHKAIDAKSYVITLISNFSNYNVVDRETTFTIVALALEFEWDYGNNYVYNKSQFKVQPIFTNLCVREDNGIKDVLVPEVSEGNKINAGSYTATLNGVNNSNYYIKASNPNINCNWEIDKKDLEISWGSSTFIFNGEHQQELASGENFEQGDSEYVVFVYKCWELKPSGTLEASQTINAGNYEVEISSITGNQASNYKIVANNSVLYRIDSKLLTTEFVKGTKVYDASSQIIGTLKIKSLPEIEVQKFKVEDIDYDSDANFALSSIHYSTEVNIEITAKNAGLYPTSIKKSNNKNYIIEYKATEFEIEKRTISVSWTSKISTYDGSEKDFSATISNKKAGDTIEISYSYSGQSYIGEPLASSSAVDAGEYTLTIQSISNPNYTLDGLSTDPVDRVLASNFIVAKREITLSLEGIGGTLEYNGGYQGRSYTVVGYINSDKNLFQNNPVRYTHSGDKVEYSNYSLSLTSVNVGDYDIKFLGLETRFNNSNYYFEETPKYAYSIIKAPVQVEWVNPYFEYNGENQVLTAAIKDISIYTNVLTGQKDVINLSYKDNIKKNAGLYEASLTGLDNSNYKLPTVTTKGWIITDRELSATWNLSDSYTYDGTYKAGILTVTNIAPADIDGVNAAFFLKSSASMTPDSITKKSSSSVELKFEKIDVGNYEYYITGINNSNYTIVSELYKLHISQREITIEWGDLSFDYDGNSREVTYTLKNIVTREDTGNKDVVNSSSTNLKKTNAGSYTGKITSLDNGNYKLPSANTKEWTIKRVVLSASWDSGNEYPYNGKKHRNILTISGFVKNENANVSLSDFAGNHINDCDTAGANAIELGFEKQDVGNYTYKVNSFSNSNYTLVVSEKVVTITPVTLEASWIGDTSYEYNGENRNINLEIAGFVNSEEGGYKVSDFEYLFTDGTQHFIPTKDSNSGSGKVILVFTIKDVGSYSLKITSVFSSNYQLASSTKNVSISKRTVNLVWSTTGNPFTYNGDNQGIYLDINNIASSDLSTFKNQLSIGGSSSYSISQKTSSLRYDFYAKNVGGYEATVSSLSSMRNYNVISGSENFSIAKADLTAIWSGALTTFEYDGNARDIYISVAGFLNGEETGVNLSSFNYSFTETPTITEKKEGKVTINVKIKDAKIYSFKLQSINSGNYQLTSSTKGVTISKRTLTLDWSIGDSFTFNGGNQGRSLEIKNIVASDLQVVKANLLIETNTQYENPTASGTKLTYSFNGKNVGQYAIQVQDKQAIQNYNRISLIEKNFSIARKELTLSWPGFSSSLVYNGTEQSVFIELSGFMNNEGQNFDISKLNYVAKSGNIFLNPTVTKENLKVKIQFKIKDAKDYSFKINTSNIADNYYVAEAIVKEVEMAKKELSYTFSSEGEYIYSGENQKATLIISGVLAGDVEGFWNSLAIEGVDVIDDYTYKGSSGQLSIDVYGRDAKTYNVRVVIISSLSNYTLGEIQESFIIKPKVLGATWAPSKTSSDYDGEDVEVSLLITGFVSGDVLQAKDFVSTMDIASSVATQNSLKLLYSFKNAGTYSVNVSYPSYSSKNYTFNSSSYTYKIDKKELELNFGTSSYSFQGLVEGEEISQDNYDLTIYTDSERTIEIDVDYEDLPTGTYYYYVVLYAFPNYIIDNVGSFTITKGMDL